MTDSAMLAPEHDDAPPIWTTHYNHPTQWDQFFAPMSMPDMFFRSAGRKGEAPLIDFMGRKYSYAETASGVCRVAKGLQDMGLGKGDRIGLFLPNVPHYVAAYYGAMAAGCTVVNFSPLYTVDELTHQVEDSGTQVLFTLSAAALLPTALEVLEKSSLERLIVGSVAGALPGGKSLFYRLFKGKETVKKPDDERITSFSTLIDNDGAFHRASIRPDQDIALLQYTGGTTGTPKGAMLTHQNLTANARQVNRIDPDHDAEDRILGVLPFFHVFANTCVLNRTVLNGGEMVILPRFDAVQALKAIDRTKVTALPGVPTMYQALLDNPRIEQTNFSPLRACISGGAPLPAEVKKKFEAKTGAKVVEGYGLTESSGVVSANPYEGLNKSGTIGQPVPGTLVRLVDKEDPNKEVPKGEPGEIIFSGPQVMKGYWNRPDADEEVFINGYLRTGDVGQIDEDGYIRIVDRIKDMIAVGGFKVFPSEVEKVLYQHDAVKEALVIGVADEYRGESPKAFVTLEEGKTEVAGDAIMQWLNPQLGKHERVVDVVTRDELPKTLIGKLDRKALRAEEADAV
ncbi:long-chain-fatty-acid--CoA ligase [Alterisphingorhabdus coralli]|uniref:Long-chain fatty acid--CoA ligase n=1 Tax=Alterisphingorhabdus coralli TaxID=3071408 RepID=A0AA97F8Z4_9SPHN|nr:long-chain fatty acid--CoA ligase [Parasphingorhabdus sp. SCSIO 66989]WOE75237.1 long-chain fatty acid--CoA ligase [Parasphingorhabdus sp. SCSIO 66989]